MSLLRAFDTRGHRPSAVLDTGHHVGRRRKQSDVAGILGAADAFAVQARDAELRVAARAGGVDDALATLARVVGGDALAV